MNEDDLHATNIDNAIDLLKECGYVVLPRDRYFSMMLYCAVHNICGFTMTNEETGEEPMYGRIH